jgi:SAM-dependent methyltransferase
LAIRPGTDAAALRLRHLQPSPAHPSFHLRRILARQLRAEISRHVALDATVLDIGCGSRPYEVLFPGTVRYVGVDWEEGTGVDVVAPSDDLPFNDASVDCVLSTQMLEHVRFPMATVGEMRRVLRPGGVALLSTHGVIRYHSNPGDYWRWTHEGLLELFAQNGPWSRVEVLPNGGTAVAIGFLAQWELKALADRTPIKAAWAPVGMALNAGIWNLERVYRRFGRSETPMLSANYLVSATR